MKSNQARLLKFVTHSNRVASIAKRYGWLPGARYTNLRDVKKFDRVGFLDIDWKNYNFRRHLDAAKTIAPVMTVARDIDNKEDIGRIIDQACELSLYSKYVVIVPKDMRLASILDNIVPKQFILGYSVPTCCGATTIQPQAFNRSVHLLGGRPDVQRKLAIYMPVFSFDCNRFTLDAAYGDYFDGEIFRPHPRGGYERCIEDSIKNINALWDDYNLSRRKCDGR